MSHGFPSPRPRALALLLGCLLLGGTLAPGCWRPPGQQPTSEEVLLEEAIEETLEQTFEDDAPAEETAAQDLPPLARFLDLLDRLEAADHDRPVNVVVLGDSHTASDTWTATFRRRLKARFGSAGRGYAYPGSPWRHFRQLDMSYTQSPGWETHHVLRTGFEGPVGFAGLRLSSPPDREVTLSRSRCNACTEEAFEVYFVRHPEGGSFTLSLGEAPSDDSEHVPDLVVQTRSEGEEVSLARVLLPVDADRAPSLHLRTRGDGVVHVLGMSSLSEAPGVRVESFGLNGAQMHHFLRSDEEHFIADLAARRADLVVLAFGTNEAFADLYGPRVPYVDPACEDESRAGRNAHALLDCEPPTLEPHPRLLTHAERLLERVRAGAPEADCILMLPPDLVPTRDDPPCVSMLFSGLSESVCMADPPWRFQVVQASLQQAAEDAGCLVWDAQAAMGGPGSMRIWMARDPALGAPDGIHLSFPGYALLGEGFFHDLMGALEVHRDGRAPWLRARPLTPEHRLVPDLATGEQESHAL